MRSSGARLVGLSMLSIAMSGCSLVAGIDDVYLASDGALDDTSLSSDSDNDASRDDGAPVDAADSLDAADAPDARDAPDAELDASVDGPRDTLGDGPTDGGDAKDSVVDATPTCPSTAGSMVMITAPGGTYCIDAHEVTNEQFNLYLADITLPFDSHPACGKWKSSTRPTPNTTPSVAKHPVSDVNYCYAWAYCRWADKRLCGHIGGGHATSTPGGDPENEWYYACANGLKQTVYPYGNSYVGATCNTDQAGSFSVSMLVDVGTKSTCHGTDPGFDQLFDMSGNVAELDDWADSYSATASDSTSVNSHGGGASWKTEATCASNDAFGIDTPFGDVGFRCCADLR